MRAGRLLPLIVVIAVQSLFTGCSNGKLTPPATVPVSGSVTYNGKPVPGVRVKFHPQFKMGKVDFIPYGETGADGKYVLNTGKPGNGAPKGVYLVTLEIPYTDVDPKDGLEAELDRLKGAYNDPNMSEWTITLKDGDNVIEPFQIQKM